MTKETYLQSNELLGTTIELRIATDAPSGIEESFAGAWQYLAEFNARFSRFLPDSELSRVNASAGQRIEVSAEFWALIQAAKELYTLSNGLFDPLVLPELQRSGYLESLVNTEKAAPDYRDRKAAAFSAVECGHGSVTLPPHSALDLGGIGKGYAADALGQLLSDSWLHLCLSLGGDIYVSGSEDEEPWILDVESLNGETITYQGTDAPYGIATSGLIRRGSTPHLIDPRTRELAYAEYKLATVVAPTTTAADVLASCILIAGPAEAERLIKSGTITAALLQKRGGAPLLLGSGNGNASGFTIS